MPLHVGVIVEGHGEVDAIRLLLEKIWYEMLDGDYLIVLPWRGRQGQLLKADGLKKAVEAVKIKLDHRDPTGCPKLILILIDAEKECPKDLAPKLLLWAKDARADADVACVLPCPMFETWFVACAGSLAGANDLPADVTTPEDPEGDCLGKSWIKNKLPRKYSETVDQPRFVAKMDLNECRSNSASFDKLCRELAKRKPLTQDENEKPSAS